MKTKSKIFNYLGSVCMGVISASLVIGSAGIVNAVDPSEVAKQSLGSEGGKRAINEALKIGRSKPSLALATTVVCLTCVPVAGATASASMCVACGILIAKTFG